MQNLYFYEVLDRLMNTKEPLKAKRLAWKDKMYLKMEVAQDKRFIAKHKVTKLVDRYSAYTASNDDLLADDWIIEY